MMYLLQAGLLIGKKRILTWHSDAAEEDQAAVPLRRVF